MHRGWIPCLGALFPAGSSTLQLLVITSNGDSARLFIDGDAGDDSHMTALCAGLTASRSLTSLLIACQLGHAPRCCARLLSSLVAHPTLVTCNLLGPEDSYSYYGSPPADTRDPCPQLGRVIADMAAASTACDVPLKSLSVPVFGRSAASAEADLVPLLRVLPTLSAALTPNRGLTSLRIRMACHPSVDFVINEVLPVARSVRGMIAFKIDAMFAEEREPGIWYMLKACSDIAKDIVEED